MKVGILIASYNRPEYLQQCLASVKASDLSQVQTVLIVDDCSTDKETTGLINEFELPGVELIKAFSKENRSIKGSLLFGLDLLFSSADVVINLDGDAIVSRNFVTVLMDLHETFPEHIKTGFNCLTRNRDGSERHKVLTTGVGYNTKASVGGINMLFDTSRYEKWVRPSLLECLQTQGNWDHKSCLRSQADGFSIICAVPSVCDHIGFDSAMGHSKGGEPPDVAADFEEDIFKKVMYSLSEDTVSEKSFMGWVTGKLRLPMVTLVGADCVNIDRLIRAADYACKDIIFKEVKLFSSFPSNDHRVIPIRHLGIKSDYSVFMMKELSSHISTSHVLVIQHDGTVLNAKAWKNEWLEFDYIGAPWEWYTDGMNVGNGGLSLRSHRLHQILKNDESIIPINEHGVTTHKEEDHCICRLYRKYLIETYGIKFAPIEEARLFSIEGWGSENKKWNGQFGFHGRMADISQSNFIL